LGLTLKPITGHYLFSLAFLYGIFHSAQGIGGRSIRAYRSALCLGIIAA
jgi:hypothetical protein